MQVEIGETIEKVKEIVFGDIYRTTKFRYSNKKDFAFNKYIDESAQGWLDTFVKWTKKWFEINE